MYCIWTTVVFGLLSEVSLRAGYKPSQDDFGCVFPALCLGIGRCRVPSRVPHVGDEAHPK